MRSKYNFNSSQTILQACFKLNRHGVQEKNRFLFEGGIENSVPRDHRLSSRVLSRFASLLEAEVPQLKY